MRVDKLYSKDDKVLEQIPCSYKIKADDGGWLIGHLNEDIVPYESLTLTPGRPNTVTIGYVTKADEDYFYKCMKEGVGL